MPITLPCDTDAGDTITLALIGGCAALTTRAKGGQVNLTPADARKAAAWLVACADEIETSLARVRAEREEEALPCLPGCRMVTHEVNRGYCHRCRGVRAEAAAEGVL